VEGESELEVRFDIRKARAEDADAIVEVLDHVPFLKDRYRGEAGISLVENNLEMIWLADLNGRVASVMIVQRKDDFGRLEISLIVTKPDLVAYAENDISRDLFISEQFSLVPEVQNEQGHPMYRFSGT
jgi:hypothetical protein